MKKKDPNAVALGKKGGKKMTEAKKMAARENGKKGGRPKKVIRDEDTEPDWDSKCDNCGASPVVPVTGLCGPCTFGEADTLGGNW